MQSTDEQQSIVKEQSGMRKTLRAEAKAAAAAKEQEKAAKKAEKEEKEQKKDERRKAREAKAKAKADKDAAKKRKADDADEKPKVDDKPETKRPRRSKSAAHLEKTQEPTGSSKDKKRQPRKPKEVEHADAPKDPKERKAKVTSIMTTPCKVWNPHGTPKKQKQREKREIKAQEALKKLTRQKELLGSDLEDLTEPKDESKMTLTWSLYTYPFNFWFDVIC